MIPSLPPYWDIPAFKQFFDELYDWLYSTQAKAGFGLLASEDRDGRTLSLSKRDIVRAVAETPFRLQLLDATSGGVAKVRVRLGNVAGRKADASMTSITDDPVFTKTLTANGNRIIQCKVTVAYDTATGVWSSTACAIEEVASLTANDATHIYLELGNATRASNGSGGYAVTAVNQVVSGDQWVARVGDGSTYVDYNGLV